ncbi:MAG TPA: TetR/AcrR family transcriptional regulator [Solirubrobacteraceae bacterium]|nr:TetR/AcrR family transcriptional regulator [Solirubrobacteraceae bacterium]
MKSTMVSENPGRPRRGRPRSQRSRTAILSAAGELMLERGLSEISMDAVAERAAVSKATIYRWWPSKELLVLDALLNEWGVGSPDAVDTGSLGGDLRALILPWVRQLTARPYGRVISALIAGAQTDERFAEEYRAHFVALRREPARIVFRRACERGEIPAGTNVDAALDLLYGPFYHRLLHGHAPLTESFARTIVDFVVAAVSAPVEVRR